MKVAETWKDYELIATSRGQKLERWKDIYLLRPDPQVIWDEGDLLEKYHVNVSDEFLAITLLGSTIIKNIEIVDNGPKVEVEPIQSEVNDSVNDSFIEQSFEASDDN